MGSAVVHLSVSCVKCRKVFKTSNAWHRHNEQNVRLWLSQHGCHGTIAAPIVTRRLTKQQQELQSALDFLRARLVDPNPKGSMTREQCLVRITQLEEELK